MDVQQYLDHPERLQEEAAFTVYMSSFGPKSDKEQEHANTHVPRVIYGETFPEKLHGASLAERIDHYLAKENLPEDEAKAVNDFKHFLINGPSAKAAASDDKEPPKPPDAGAVAPGGGGEGPEQSKSRNDDGQGPAKNVFQLPGSLPSAQLDDDESEAVAGFNYHADPNRQAEKAMASAFLSDSHTAVKFGTTAHNTLQKAIEYDNYPEHLQKAPLQDRLGFYASKEPRTDAESKAVKEFREYLVNGKSPQLKNDTLGAGDIAQPPLGAVDQAAQMTRQVITAPFEGLSRFFGGFGERAAARATNEQIEAATTRMVSEQEQAGERIEAKFEGLKGLVKQMDDTPAGPERDKLVEKFCEGGHELAKEQRDISRKQANDSADPNVKSRFKQGEGEIEKSAESTDDRLANMFRQMQDKASGDEKNVEKLKQEQSKIAEMLQRVKEMVQQIFGGFREGKKNTAGPSAP